MTEKCISGRATEDEWKNVYNEPLSGRRSQVKEDFFITTDKRFMKTCDSILNFGILIFQNWEEHLWQKLSLKNHHLVIDDELKEAINDWLILPGG